MDKPKPETYIYNNYSMPLAVQIATAMGMMPKWRRKAKVQKKCLQCGRTHEHNNAFCSAECCKLYKEAKR